MFDVFQMTGIAADVVRRVLGHRNPNGCPVRITWFVSHTYTDYHAVTQFFANGHEIASHTVDHLSWAADEGRNITQYTRLRDLLRVYSGTKDEKIVGERAPFLVYDSVLFQQLKLNGFTWDCSISEAPGFLSTSPDSLIFPYTMDSGVAQTCNTGVCTPGVNAPGMWVIPMYDFLGKNGEVVASMDPVNLLDSSDSFFDILWRNFQWHYSGNRAPMGIWLHPAYLLANSSRLDDLNR